VICDRFVPSTIAYQGFGRGASIAMIENITQVAIGNFKPNLTILMFIDPEIGHARAEQRRKGTELRFTSFDADYHARVYTGFMSLITIPDDYYYSLYLPFQVDPKNSIDEVFTNLMLMIKPRLKKSLRLCGDPIFDREDDKNI
jgi:dTMP kinase